jgi:hypothetical protein
VALATLFQLLRPTSLDEQRAQQRYRAEVEKLAGQVKTIFDDWLILREHQSEYAELANAAAVNRWELMRMVTSVEQLVPPRSLTGVHRDLQNAIAGSARACQLLASGYRGHKSEAVCDGQALLVESVADLSALLDQLTMRA